MYGILLRYVQKYGQLPSHGVKSEGQAIGNWLVRQRHDQRAGKLSNELRDERAQALAAIPGWDWLRRVWKN